METITPNNAQVAIIENSISIFKEAPEVLQANQLKTQKAVMIGENILDQWQKAWSIEDEEEKLTALAAADERSNNYLVNCNNAVKQQKEQRAAITQMMDAFKKMFTDAENQIDKAKADSIPSKVQTNRDTYAKKAFEISERRRKEAERVAAKAKEAIEIKSEAGIRLFNKYNEHLLGQKTKIQNSFNAITLADYQEKKEKLNGYAPALNPEIIKAFELGLFGSYHTKDEIKTFIEEIIEEKLPQFTSNYAAEMNLLKEDLLEKLPSKKAELDEKKRLDDEAAAELERQRKEKEERDARIAQANAAEKKRLEAEAEQTRIANEKRNADLKAQQEKAAAEQKQREEEENMRLQREADEAKKAAEQEIEIKKQGDQTMVMFEQEAALAESVPTNISRQGYDIEVLHPVGWTQIFALWFEQEGKNLPVDKIGNTKMDQMKAWAEKIAHKSGTKIESKFIKYVESFTAVNKKAKA